MKASDFLFQSIYFDDLSDPETTERQEHLEQNPWRVMDILFPTTKARSVSVFFIHGGGWRKGHRSGFHRLMRNLAERGIASASTDYTLQGSCLEQLRDVRHGYDLFRRLLAERSELGEVVVIGSSAGAHLGQLLTHALPGACREPLHYNGTACSPRGWVRPAGLVAVTGPVTTIPGNNVASIERSFRAVMDKPDDPDPTAYRRVSPLEHVGPDSPPVFLVAAEDEDYFLLENNERFISQMQFYGQHAQYKIYPAEHGFLYDLIRPVQRQAWRDILNFIETLESVSRSDSPRVGETSDTQ